MRPSARRRPDATSLTYLLAGALILGLALWLRLTRPYSLPVFGDEGINIHWAQEFAQGHDDGYPLLMDGRYLFGVLLAGLGIYGPLPLRFARAVVAVIALLGCAAAMGLGRQMGTRAGGLLAGWLYALLPYAVFHERQALTDPVMADVGALVVLFTLRAARPGRRAWAALSALALAAAFLFKPSGLVYGFAPALAVVCLPARRRMLGRGALTLSLAALITLVFLGALYPRLGVNDDRLRTQSLGFIQCPPIACRLDPAEQWRQLQNVAPPLPELLDVYFGWPLITLAAAAWPLTRTPARPRALFVLLFALSAGAFFLLAGRDELAPRYLSPLAAPLAALGAHGLVTVVRRLPTPALRLALAVPLTLLVLAPLANTVSLILRPERARVPAFDRHQYFTGPVGGAPFQAAALEIAAQDARPLIITRHFMRYALAAFFDPRAGRVLNPWEVRWPDVEERLAQGRALYLIDEADWGTPAGEARTRVYPYRKDQSVIRVRRVDAADPAARAELYAFVFPSPDEFRGDYAALAQALAAQTEAATLVTYPPSQLELLAGLLDPASAMRPTPIGGPAPWTPPSVIASLKALGEPARLHVIFQDETRLDPGRQVEAWLNVHFFRLSERWIGPLRWVAYAGPAGAGAEVVQAEARFGDGLDLVQIENLDPVVRPGGVVRLRLTWQAAAPAARPYKVFVHIVNGDQLLAQHDGQPVGELRPTTAWRAGEQVVDQFAIRLPTDATSGVYQFRIGLYDLETQARLPARLSDGTEAEFWLGGRLTIP